MLTHRLRGAVRNPVQHDKADTDPDIFHHPATTTGLPHAERQRQQTHDQPGQGEAELRVEIHLIPDGSKPASLFLRIKRDSSD